ncbi:MAG TPA: carbonic anhydrase [Gemmataceae bacterium]|nr:carbonic anhydrase [Gemmataceae bacterium]
MNPSLSDANSLTREPEVDLGPHLPMAVYHAMERWHPERIGALALYCSDGRWGEAFDEFCHRHLQIPRYDRWAVPGGPAWVAGEASGREAARTQLDFLVRAHELEQVVLITHFGCAWYGHRLGQSPVECLAAQAKDVRLAANTLRTWFPDLHVEAYLAMRNDRWLSFHELDLSGGWPRRGHFHT